MMYKISDCLLQKSQRGPVERDAIRFAFVIFSLQLVFLGYDS